MLHPTDHNLLSQQTARPTPLLLVLPTTSWPQIQLMSRKLWSPYALRPRFVELNFRSTPLGEGGAARSTVPFFWPWAWGVDTFRGDSAPLMSSGASSGAVGAQFESRSSSNTTVPFL